MRLGGPVFGDVSTPELWAASVLASGYGAAYCPVKEDASDEVVRAYADAAKKANIVIAEVGAWSNPISPDDDERRKSLERNVLCLGLAERIGARCCVNISGSRGSQWDGPHPSNLTDETFDRVVQTVRGIIDAVNPKRTFYTLETMPWMFPDSTASYRKLIKAVRRKAFAVHFDPANLISGVDRYYSTGAIIREFVSKLGRHIRSCHAKDVRLAGKMTTRIEEVPPGLGEMDYRAFLTEIDRLDPDTTVMLEHLSAKEEYDAAAAHVRSVAREVGATFRS